MASQPNTQKIKKLVEEFIQKTGFLAEVEVKNIQDSTLPVNLTMEEPQIFIGEGGQTLSEIQHLLKLILRKQFKVEGPFYINLDINNYKQKKSEYLKETARSAADEVALVKKEKHLPPMPAHERRIIHLELAGREDIVSESVGEGGERRIVVKPREGL